MQTQYDGLGRAFKVSNPYGPSDTTLYTQTAYDGLSRATTVTPPSGGFYQYSYAGNATTVTDPSNQQRRTHADALGRLVQVDEPGLNSGTPSTGTLTITSKNSNGGVQTYSGVQATGSFNVSGAEQSKQVQTQAATPGTGSVSVSGSEQSTQVLSHAATAGTGSLTVSGSEQSTQVLNTAATQATGSVTISGTEKIKRIIPCYVGDGPCSIPDQGDVWITVGSVTASVSYGQGDNTSTIASALVTAINGNSSFPATATSSIGTVYLTSKASGAAANLALSASEDYDTTDFSSPSFTPSPSGSTLTGGKDATYNTVYDAGTATVTINGHSDLVSWGNGSSAASIASAIASAIQGDGAAAANASASGATVSLSARTTGSATNYSLAASTTYDTSHFGSSSYAFSISGSTLTGGTDAAYTTVYDAGTATITVNGHGDAYSWGNGSSASSIASGLASAINGDGGAAVSASASGSTINLTARTTGSGTNYSLAASTTYDNSHFGSSSYAMAASGAALTGGTNAGYNTAYDTGTVSVTVNGFTATANYDSGSTQASIASALVTAFGTTQAPVPGSPVTATSSGAAVTLTAVQPGPNYSFAVTSATTSSNFSQPSYCATTAANSTTCSPVTGTGGTLAGGANPVNDSGTVTATLAESSSPNTVSETISYSSSQNSSTCAVASVLASAFNGDSKSPVTAAVSTSPCGSSLTSATIQLTTKAMGDDPTYSASGSSTWNTSTFSSASFTISGTAVSGGLDPAGSLSTPVSTTYLYDPLDDLTQVTEGSQTRSYLFDGLGRMTSATTPEAGKVTYGYYNFGMLQTRTDARGVVTTYTPDAANRLQSISYSVGSSGAAATPTVSFAYGGQGAACDAAGRLTSMTDGVGSETYCYNNMGSLTTLTKVISGTTYPISYGYDNLEDLTSITYPSGRQIVPSYDVIGRLQQIASGGTNFISNLSYNAAGKPLGFTYGNGVTASFNYNDHLQINTLGYVSGSNSLLNLTYNYGSTNNGQIMSITDARGATYSTSYQYDPLGRLQQAQTNDLTSANTWQLNWSYDRYGNRLSQSLTAGQATAFTPQLSVDPTTNRINTPGYQYDASGDTTNDTLHSYVYDAENRMVQVDGGAASYVYDGNGLRVKKTVGSTTTSYLYSGGRAIAEYFAGSLAKEYIYSGGLMIAEIPAGGTPVYGQSDHLSIRVQTDASGTAVRTYGHFPFGDTWYETGTTDKWKFAGDELDVESNLDHTWFRQLSSTVGRWASPDPASLSAASLDNPQSLNLYAYVLNNPVINTDPLGLVCNPDTSDCSVDPTRMGPNGGVGGGGIFGNGNAWDIGNIPVSVSGWIPGSSTNPTPILDKNGNPVLDSQGNPVYGMSADTGHWGSPAVGTGFDFGFGVDTSWWQNFGSAFISGIVHGVRQPGQSFKICVIQNANETTGGAVNKATAQAVAAIAAANAALGSLRYLPSPSVFMNGMRQASQNVFGAAISSNFARSAGGYIAGLLGAGFSGMRAGASALEAVSTGGAYTATAIAGGVIGLTIGSAINCR